MGDNDYDFASDNRQAPGYTYIALNGRKKTLPLPPGGCFDARTCCLSCCPWFVDPCSEERKNEWKDALVSVTYGLIFVQVVMLIVSMGIGGVTSFKNNPMIGPRSDAFIKIGAKYGPLIKEGQVWRFLISPLLHAGIFHLIFNVYSQMRFGIYAERKWGSIKYTIAFFVSSFGATLLSCLVKPNAIGVGASGAVCGIFGCHFADIIISKHKTSQVEFISNIANLVFFVIILMSMSAVPLIDTAAHFGGLFTGFFIGMVLHFKEAETQFQQRLYLILGASLNLIWFLVGFLCFYLVVKTD